MYSICTAFFCQDELCCLFEWNKSFTPYRKSRCLTSNAHLSLFTINLTHPATNNNPYDRQVGGDDWIFEFKKTNYIDRYKKRFFTVYNLIQNHFYWGRFWQSPDALWNVTNALTVFESKWCNRGSEFLFIFLSPSFELFGTFSIPSKLLR